MKFEQCFIIHRHEYLWWKVVWGLDSIMPQDGPGAGMPSRDEANPPSPPLRVQTLVVVENKQGHWRGEQFVTFASTDLW